MKKLLISVLLISIFSTVTNAQWKVESVASSEPNTTLLQVLETENSVLVYATFEKTLETTALLNLSRSTYVKAGGLKYKIINSVNLPIKDDGETRFAYLQKGANELNFVMEFEKFPLKDGFDIIEKQEDGEWCFNFHGVTVSPIDASAVLDTKRFLDSEAPVIAGRYSENGYNYLYYIRDGVCVTCNAVTQSGKSLGDDEIFYVSIVNNSDHGVTFDFDKVGIVGVKTKSNGQVENKDWTKYSPDSYEQYFASMDYAEARHNSAGILSEIGDQLNREKLKTEFGTWARIGMDALGALNEQAIQNRVNDYMKANPKEHPTALRSNTVKAGESIHGFVAAKPKKADSCILTIPMDGFDFTYTFTK